MTEDITEADILAEIEKYRAAGDEDEVEPGTITRPEVCEQLKLSRSQTQIALVKMVNAGILERVWVKRNNGWQWTRVKGYRLVK